jgi:hypothetical protein
MKAQEQAVLDLFTARPHARMDEIDAAIWPDDCGRHGSTPPSERDKRSMQKQRQVIVCAVRKMLAKQGKHLNSIYGWGYRVEDVRAPNQPRSAAPAPVVRLRATPRWNKYRRDYEWSPS